jgi:hypothetical protein
MHRTYSDITISLNVIWPSALAPVTTVPNTRFHLLFSSSLSNCLLVSRFCPSLMFVGKAESLPSNGST